MGKDDSHIGGKKSHVGLVQEKSEALEENICTSCPKCGNKGAFCKLSQTGRGGRAYVRLTACLFLAAISAAKKRLKQGLSDPICIYRVAVVPFLEITYLRD
jgi:hypothetical protein